MILLICLLHIQFYLTFFSLQDDSTTIIDKIFSNNTDDETISSNISHHFSQFLFLKNPKSLINPVTILLMIILTLAKKNLFMILKL